MSRGRHDARLAARFDWHRGQNQSERTDEPNYQRRCAAHHLTLFNGSPAGEVPMKVETAAIGRCTGVYE